MKSIQEILKNEGLSDDEIIDRVLEAKNLANKNKQLMNANLKMKVHKGKLTQIEIDGEQNAVGSLDITLIEVLYKKMPEEIKVPLAIELGQMSDKILEDFENEN